MVCVGFACYAVDDLVESLVEGCVERERPTALLRRFGQAGEPAAPYQVLVRAQSISE